MVHVEEELPHRLGVDSQVVVVLHAETHTQRGEPLGAFTQAGDELVPLGHEAGAVILVGGENPNERASHRRREPADVFDVTDLKLGQGDLRVGPAGGEIRVGTQALDADARSGTNSGEFCARASSQSNGERWGRLHMISTPA